jgi:hypothetical protein
VQQEFTMLPSGVLIRERRKKGENQKEKQDNPLVKE